MATSKELNDGLLAELSYVDFRDESLTKGDVQANSDWYDFATKDITDQVED
jgi:hypothetical protein